MSAWFRNRMFLVVWLVVGVGLVGGCSDDDGTNNGTSASDCGPGETFSQLTGRCLVDTDTDAGDLDGGADHDDVNDDDGDAGGQDVRADDDIDPPPVDTGGADATQRCRQDLDSDEDGLTNACECQFSLDPYEADTDGDGLDDGQEDANQNCRFDAADGETDPRVADTDADGLDDGQEDANGTDPLAGDTDQDGVGDGAEVSSGCMDPNNEDTDGDGLPDGVEDGNADGVVGECSAEFAVDCAQGESDPCAADTDGDGTDDQDEAQYRNCRPSDTDNLVEPQFIENASADYKLAAEASLTAEPVTFASGTATAHVFGDSAPGYTGFVAAIEPTNGLTNSSLLSDEVISTVQDVYPTAARRSSGRQVSTHNGNTAVVDAVADLPAGTDPGAGRDAILAALADVPEADITHGLAGNYPGTAGEPTLFVYEVVSRSSSQYMVVGAFVTLSAYQDNTAETGFRVDDLTGGPSLGKTSDTLTPDCVSYRVTAEPEVDIVISLDASGSMSDEQQALSNFALEFTGLLNDANVDWRVAVTGTSCGDISTDDELSQAYRDLWPTNSGGGGFFPDMDGVCASPPFGMEPAENGALVGGDFSRDPAEIATRLAQVDDSDSEYTMTMGVAGIDRSLPRAADEPTKIRPDAAVVLISVTDEGDNFFKEKFDFLPTQQPSLSQGQQLILEDEVQSWVDYLLRDDIGATAFGLYWPPGEACGGAADVAHGIAQVVSETGGNGGSICQADITNTLAAIADDTAGIASGLRLRGTAAPQTIEVKRGSAATGTISGIDRSRADGFDYDAVVNRVIFRGPSRPQTNDRVVIPYLRWEDSVLTCSSDAQCPQEQKVRCIDGECR